VYRVEEYRVEEYRVEEYRANTRLTLNPVPTNNV